MAAAAVKLLVCGPIAGKWDAWQARVDTVNKSHGPFDLVFCIGNLFAGPQDEDNLEALPYLSGEKQIGIETLYVNGNSPMPPAALASIQTNEGSVCENVVFLGRSGILTTAAGLRLAYLSGVPGEDEGSNASLGTKFSQRDVDTLLRHSQSKGFEGVDFFLSAEWPRNVTRGIEDTTANPAWPVGSDAVANLAKELRPRYHFSAFNGGVYYERTPYRNQPLTLGRQIHVTRFFGMASCGNTNKAKWLMALNLVPLARMDPIELATEPPGTTPSPYIEQQRPGKRPAAFSSSLDNLEDNGSFFFGAARAGNSNSGRGGRGGGKRGRGIGYQDRDPSQPSGPVTPPADYVCKICQISGHFIRDCPQKTAPKQSSFKPKNTGCWFCLGNPQVEKHLVVSVGTEVYIALAKGGLTSDHVLIVPTGHFPSSPEVPPDVHRELLRYKSALASAFESVGKVVVFFEVNVRSQHMHLQALPVPKEWCDGIASAYRDQGKDLGIEFIDETDGDLTKPFFRLEVPTADPTEHTVLFYQVPTTGHFPLQFGRQVVARLLGEPSRTEWKNCVKKENEEKNDAAAFKSFFKPFDFSLLED